MLIPKLAIRNILGAGLRTWLNVLVLSFAYVAIIFNHGFYHGLTEQVSRARIAAELGGGQFWHRAYDPYDPFTLREAHGKPAESIQAGIDEKSAVPILITQATAYPGGRIRRVLVKGIPADQDLLSIPTQFLEATDDLLPALIGSRTAKSMALKTGDILTIQWQDAHGTFDARDVRIAQIMETTVPTVDRAQIWVPLERLQHLLGMPDEATIVVVDQPSEHASVPGWTFRNLDALLEDIHAVRDTTHIASWFLYGLLLSLAMLAVFDTQILSVFRRRKEIGTLMAFGMTRSRVIRLFTLEGLFHGVLAAGLGAAYGIPLLNRFAQAGFAVPEPVDYTGYAVGERLYPVYGGIIVTATVCLVLITTAVVSYLPTRKIVHLKPTDALRGKLE